jgi:hypothetical protein
MLKRLLLIGFFLMFSLFAVVSCTNKPSLELVQVSAQIVTDKSISGQTGIMDGEKVIKYVTPTVISYTFTVKNNGIQKVGDVEKPVRFKLEPSEQLRLTLQETSGTDEFEKMNGGYTAATEIRPNETAKYTAFYELGTTEDLGAYQQIPLLPSKEKLEELKKRRFDATLILTAGDEEIARFDLQTAAFGWTPEIQQKMEKELGTKMVVPLWEGYQVKYAAIQHPPVVKDQPVGDRRVATIVYTDQRGPFIDLNPEQKRQLESKQRRTVFYGEFEGKPLIRIEISNERGSLMEANVQDIDGVEVEFQVKEFESGKYGIYSFNLERSSYFITFRIDESFTQEDAVEFIRRIITASIDRTSFLDKELRSMVFSSLGSMHLQSRVHKSFHGDARKGASRSFWVTPSTVMLCDNSQIHVISDRSKADTTFAWIQHSDEIDLLIIFAQEVPCRGVVLLQEDDTYLKGPRLCQIDFYLDMLHLLQLFLFELIHSFFLGVNEHRLYFIEYKLVLIGAIPAQTADHILNKDISLDHVKQKVQLIGPHIS